MASTTFEDLEFHPDQITALLPKVARWTTRDAEPGRSRISNGVIARRAGLDRYAAHFAEARALNRRITVVIGPTNSGKSHYALDRLGCSSRAALPSRRFACWPWNSRTHWPRAGCWPASMTGEERQVFPGARHVACTVEMAHTSRTVDVAVIDEAQMLADPDRGAAWTAAIMGIPGQRGDRARRSGLPAAGPPNRRTLRRTDGGGSAGTQEPVARRRPRPSRWARSPMRMPWWPSRAGRFLPFARAAGCPRTHGRRDLRRARARRCAARKAGASARATRPTLVATDAIGMGLNLPIRRVVFSALTKWDGRQDRSLTPAEVRQIGGRAGRYGQHEEGIVAVLAGGGDPARLRALMETEPAPPLDLRPQVSPDRRIVAAIAEELGTTSLLETLRRIRGAVLRPGDPNYRLADAGDADGDRSGHGRHRAAAAGPLDLCALPGRRARRRRIDRLAPLGIGARGRRHTVRVPTAGHLPAPQRADQAALERAEKAAKRLVAWRWLSQHFPESYADDEIAAVERKRLDGFIEGVLQQQAIGRSRRGGPRPQKGPERTAANGKVRGAVRSRP